MISDQTDYGKLKAMVENGNVIWDVVDVERDFAYQAAEDGLLEPLDFSIIDKSELDEDFVFDYGVGSFAYSFVNAYNTDKVSGANVEIERKHKLCLIWNTMSFMKRLLV